MGCMSIKLRVCEENGATIKIVMKGQATSMRHVSTTHRENVAWLNDAIQHDGNINTKCVNKTTMCGHLRHRLRELRSMEVSIVGCCVVRHEPSEDHEAKHRDMCRPITEG